MKNYFFMLAIVFGMVAVSCSSDDDKGTTPAETFTLVGDWQLTNVDFTVYEEEGRPASDACMVELVVGYKFLEDNTFYFVLNEAADSRFGAFIDEDTWTWTGDVEGFSIIQSNPAMPPYNFGLNPSNVEVKKVDGQTVLTFRADMANGSTADFTLVKGNINIANLPSMTLPDGTPYACGLFN